MKKTKGHSDGIKLQGFFRVQLTEDGKGVIGDSGWTKNQVTDLGIRQYVVDWLCSGAGKSVTHMALGTGGAPASNATSLSGEVSGSAGAGRQAVSSSVVASGTAQFTGAFASANSFVTATANISNIGLFNTSTVGGGTIFAGNTFASSSCATNQSVFKKLADFKFFKLREHLFETIRSEILNWRRSETIIRALTPCEMMG